MAHVDELAGLESAQARWWVYGPVGRIFGFLLIPWLGIALLCVPHFPASLWGHSSHKVYVARLIAWTMIVLPAAIVMGGMIVVAVMSGVGLIANAGRGGIGWAPGWEATSTTCVGIVLSCR